MKKIKTLLVALTTASMLASCGGKGSWKEFSYKRVLDDDEKAVLLGKVITATFSKVNKIEWNYNYERTTALRHSTLEQKQVTEYFQKGELAYELSTKNYKKEDNVEQKEEHVAKKSRALYDEENRKYAIAMENGLTGAYTYSEEVVPEIDEAKIYAGENCEIIEALQGTGPGEMKAYEDKKGQIFFVSSSVNEVYETEGYGHYKKVKHTIEKSQDVCLLNEDFSIKSLSMLATHETNKDPDTNEFSKKVKEDSRAYWEYKLSYGDRADGSSKVGALRADAKDGYRLQATPTVKGIALKADGTELGEAPFTKVQSRQVGFGKYHFVYKVEAVPPKVLEEEVASLKVKLAGNSISNAKEDPVAIDAEIPVGTLVAGNSGLSLDGGVLKMGKANVNISIEFDLEATADGASFSNVVANAELYIPAE